MTIQVKQKKSHYFGYITPHIEYGGIFQIRFKPIKEKPFCLPDWE